MRRAAKETLWLLVAFIMVLECYSDDKWLQCHNEVAGCNCKWISGKKTAVCDNANIETIPSFEKANDLQSLILDNNNIPILNNEIFREMRLINLQRISMRNCSIREIEKNAFAGLGILFELDLGNNLIRKLEPGVFQKNEKLRLLNLDRNSLEKLEDGLFSEMYHLQQVSLNHNRISNIGHKAFNNVPVLRVLHLNGNLLTHLKREIFHIGQLTSLELKDNPWKCDCHLRPFVTWYNETLYTDPTTCAEPDYLQNIVWKSIKPDQLACKPDIMWPSTDAVFEATVEELTLACKVTGDPRPEAYWTFNSRPIGNKTIFGPNLTDRKYIEYESEDGGYWLNVTISKINRQDHGTYTCVAKNAAGIVERNVSLAVQQGQVRLFDISRASISDVWVLLLCLFIGIVCALILIFMLCFLCCRRAETMVAKKPPTSANGDVTHHIVIEPEQQKTLLTAVNPVQKPPRKYDSSPQSDRCAETELNRNLLDDTSVLGGTSVAGDSMEERRSNNSIEQLSSCNSQDNLLLERPRPLNRTHHPPDLLAFSNRRTQGSPAGSIVSTDTDCTRFRAIHSPVRSPIYQMHQYTPSYETLPYSRTQSPFSPTSITPIQHRQGYVTIPRRPRIPSWSSSTTPTKDDVFNKTEPVYDNLGPRTTADGSSVLSLTRKVAETPNMRTRPLPPAPLYTSHTLPHKAKLNHVYLSIRKNEEPQFRPITQTSPENRGVIRPLPLQYSPSNETPVPDKKRASWAPRQVPESGVLKKITPAESPTKNITQRAKVPPKPPPKPKKNGPLFEDEGEDGTEV